MKVLKAVYELAAGQQFLIQHKRKRLRHGSRLAQSLDECKHPRTLPETLSNLAGASLTFLKQISVSRHGKQRPTIPVHVVFEIEYFREPCAGGFVLAPGAV